MAHIYKITNIINDKGYVGRTENDPKKRWREHLAAARNNPLMVISKAIRKHGVENFRFEILEQCSVEDQYIRESQLIEEHDTYHNGYNSSLGGEGAGAGIKRQRGAVHPFAKAVDQYDLEGKYLCTYDSLGEAAYAAGVRDKKGVGSINSCIKGITFQAYGYRWSLKGEPLKEVSNRINRKGKVYGIHLESGRKKMWENAADVAEEIEENRRANSSIGWALERNDQPDKTKTQVKGWNLFRDRKIALSDWKPCIPRCKTMSREERSRMSKISAEKRKIPIKGVNIKTGEEIYFNSMSEASFFLKGDGNFSATANIVSNIKRLEEGKDSYCLGYKWYKA